MIARSSGTLGRMSAPPSTRYNEMEVNSELFDRTPCPVRAKVFICSTQRTGSYLLCRAMIHHGIGVPHEYFHYLHAGIIGARFGIAGLPNGQPLETDGVLRRAYTSALLDRRTVNGIFAAKIQWTEYTRYLDNPEGHEMLRNAHFIYLYREDLLDQAISVHVAMQTGRWGFGDLITTLPAANPRFFDDDAINRYLERIARHDMQWRMFFARNQISPLVISYEQLRNDLPGFLGAIVLTFNLHVPTKEFDYVEENARYARNPGVPPNAEIKAAYVRAHQRVVPASSRHGRA
jgi:LPS sulfotransferase NodH